jgi:hypothetical protein
MKKLFLASLAILLFLPGFSQEGKINTGNFGKQMEGYVIKSNGKKMTGTMIYAHPVKMSKEVLFNGTIYKPDQLKEFYVDGNNWISVTEKNDQMFAVCTRYGPITVYKTFSYPEGVEYGNESTPWEDVLYQIKLDEERVAVAGFLLGFKKKMSEYVSDYPEMAKKIENKEKGYGAMNHYQIVDEYNAWYIEQHPEYAMAEDSEDTGVTIPEGAVTVDVPEGLYGKWHHEDYTFTIEKGIIKFDYDVSGGQTVNTVYLIQEYDEKYGFICGDLIDYMSFGFDAMESFQDHVGFLYFTELTDDTVLIYFQGHGVLANADKYALHQEPAEFKFLANSYSRVK